MVERLKLHLFKIKDNIDDVFDDPGKAGEFMRRPFDAHRGNCRPFQRRKQHAAQGISQRMAVTGLKRLCDEFGVSIGSRDLIFHKGLRHLESSETNWHLFGIYSPGFPGRS